MDIERLFNRLFPFLACPVELTGAVGRFSPHDAVECAAIDGPPSTTVASSFHKTLLFSAVEFFFTPPKNHGLLAESHDAHMNPIAKTGSPHYILNVALSRDF